MKNEECRMKITHPMSRVNNILHSTFFILHLIYDKNLISTPAATAEPITPEMLEDMQ